MALDQTIALQVKPPNIDFPGMDSKAVETLRNEAATKNLSSETAARDYNVMSEQLGRAAKDVLMQPPGEARNERWQYHVNDFQRKGYLDPKTADYYRKSGPSELVLNQAIAHSMSVSEHSKITGQTSRAEAAGRAPYEGRETDPDKPFSYPAMRPGAPNTGVGTIPQGQPPAAPAFSTAQVVPNTAPNPQASGAVQPNTTAAQNKEDLEKNNPYYKEAPVVKVGSELPSGPGIVNQGRDPAAVQARNGAFKKVGEEIEPAVKNAATLRASLGSLRSQLLSGKGDSSALAGVKQELARYAYALAGGGANGLLVAKNLTGMDLPTVEAMDKDMVRMGLQYARQTEGAREAVAAINIALRGNPSLLTSKEGNLKIINMMDAAAEHDIEMGKGAQAYMMKQQHETGTAHLSGFENHWADKHSPATFVSKAVPYQIPVYQDGTNNTADMKKGVTYEFTPKDKDGKPQTDPKTNRPVVVVGVWNGQKLVGTKQ